MNRVKLIPEVIRKGYLNLLTPLVNLLIKLDINPNIFTTVGLIISMVSAYFFAIGGLRIAGLLILLAGTFDVIDGMVARASHRVTKFGALYDSTLDRYAEVIVFFGLAYYFVSQGWFVTSVAVSVALGGSIMVSYVRARAEGLGFQCKVGIMQRQERIVYIGFGALIHKYVLIAVIFMIAALANLTAIQRLYHVWSVENNRKRKELKEEAI